MRRSIASVLGGTLSICCSHKWLLLTCLIATITYAMVSPETYYVLPYSTRDFAFEHGWPTVYMVRVSDWGWGNWNSGLWRIDKGIRDFHLGAFLGDIAVAMGLSLVATSLWHLHCLVNWRPWQIGLKEALVVTLALGMAIGAFKKLRDDYNQEMAFLTKLEATGWALRCSSDGIPWYLRPLNDLGIIRDVDWLYVGIDWPSVYPEKPSDNINDVLARLASERAPLAFVHYVGIVDSRLDDEGVKSLCKFVPHCTDLYLGDYLPNVTEKAIAHISSHLRDLHILSLRGVKLTNEGVERIAAMRKLNELRFDDRWKTTTRAGLKSLLALPYMHSLGIPEHWTVTDEEKAFIELGGPSVSFLAPYEE